MVQPPPGYHSSSNSSGAPSSAAPSSAAQRSLLVALRENDNPGAVLRWALEMAGALTAQLHVLQVLPGNSYRLARRSTRFFAEVLRSPGAAPAQSGGVIESAGVLQGDFVQQIAQYAAAAKPTLIVLASDGMGPGGLATLLACSAQRLVLVAHDGRKDRASVTDGMVLASAAVDLFRDGAVLHPALAKHERFA